jgi:very-short-patch-repair endonuclease
MSLVNALIERFPLPKGRLVSPDEQIARIAADQHGAFSHEQARRAGHTAAAIKHRVLTGRWWRLHRGIYTIAGASATWERDVVAATLAVGGVASHVTAGRLHGLTELSGAPIHVTVPPAHKRRTRTGVRLHEAALGRADVRRVRGIPVTAPNRTLIDLARVLPRARLEAAVDAAILLRLTTAKALLASIGPRPTKLRRVVLDRMDGVPESELERLFERKLKRSRLPTPVRQLKIGRRRIDYAYPDRKIAIELDGFATHSSAPAKQRDDRRRNELVLLGWNPLHFSWYDVHDDWPATAQTIRKALDGAG